MRIERVVVVFGLLCSCSASETTLPVELPDADLSDVGSVDGGAATEVGSPRDGGLDAVQTPLHLATVKFQVVSAGYRHTCARTATEGVLYCWGDNSHGEATPPPIPSGIMYYNFSAGNGVTCGVSDLGDMRCWGRTQDGSASITTPPPGKYSTVSVGDHHACAITSAGQAVCWGEDRGGGELTPPGETFTKIGAGGNRSCGVSPLKCWGAAAGTIPGAQEQIAVGANDVCVVSDTMKVTCAGTTAVSTDFPTDLGWLYVTVGDAHACALKGDGTVKCWGSNADGRATPPDGILFRQVDAGAFHTCGITTDRYVMCWGADDAGQSTIP